MLTFTIDRNNHITALTTTPQAQVNPEDARFSGAKELGRITKRWPGPLWCAIIPCRPASS